jgi:homoserine kinase
VALELYVEVEVREAGHLVIESFGEGDAEPKDATHLAARVATAVCGHDHLSITVRSQIPIGRGLGSSAALAVATAAASGAPDPLAVAASFDGHVENAAASVLGGLVAATIVDGRPVAARLPLDPGLVFVVIVPDRQVSTEAARAVLHSSVGFGDAVFNLGRMGLLVAGLASHESLIAQSTNDRLHQDARTALFPEAPVLLDALVSAGALASCWSGAGSSLLGICASVASAEAVAAAGDAALKGCGLKGETLRLSPDTAGLVVSD